jgi:CheY-like chemotaxis protein
MPVETGGSPEAGRRSAGGPLLAARVLIVDDSPHVRDFVSELLEQAGAMVMTAATAEQALELVTHWRPDALISDLEMPTKDGYWLIRQVRALAPERGGTTPAACLTGHTGSDVRASVLRAGFQYHVAKPFDIRTLIGIVENVVPKP